MHYLCANTRVLQLREPIVDDGVQELQCLLIDLGPDSFELVALESPLDRCSLFGCLADEQAIVLSRVHYGEQTHPTRFIKLSERPDNVAVLEKMNTLARLFIADASIRAATGIFLRVDFPVFLRDFPVVATHADATAFTWLQTLLAPDLPATERLALPRDGLVLPRYSLLATTLT